MPEYLKNKIEKILGTSDVWVFEKTRELKYDTIRKRIEKIIGSERIITWEKMPQKLLLDKIEEISPDIIHFEEPSEEFIPDFHLSKIYSENRKYKIFETLHDSSYRIENKIYLPDKFILVSPWQVSILRNLGVPCEVVEHELPARSQRNYQISRARLGLDPNKKHIVQIGIFTPRKNQAETIDIARSFPNAEFHFIGTLADNYKWYWEPLKENLPTNCKILGERNDVDLFYQAADLIIFPSQELYNDKETSPLVIKEALSWGSSLLLRNLPVYVDMYQESKNVRFMSGKKEDNIRIISEILSEDFIKNADPLFSHTFDPENNKIEIKFIGDNPTGKTYVSVKDIDSEACIYGFEMNVQNKGNSFWCIPIPKSYFDFIGDKNFSGFKIEFYNSKDSDSPFNFIDIKLKKSIKKKKIRNNIYSNFDPIFVNYTQFFVDGVYNSFFAGYRIKSAIDIGANVGLFTEWVLDRFGSDTEVLAVEPNINAAKSFSFLHGSKHNVKLETSAISAQSGNFIEMNVDPGNSLVSSFEKTGHGYSETQKVTTKSLIDLMNENSLASVDLLKVDVEGAEYDIFSTISSEEIRNRFKHLLIEFHNNKGRANSLIEKIKSAGFSVDLRDDDTRYEVDENSDRGTIFATRID